MPVTLAGGLARGAADLLVPRVTALVRELAPPAELAVLHAPPVLGAALLGLDRLAPGDHAAADRLRGEIGAWDATVPPRRRHFLTDPQLVTVRQWPEAVASANRARTPAVSRKRQLQVARNDLEPGAIGRRAGPQSPIEDLAGTLPRPGRRCRPRADGPVAGGPLRPTRSLSMRRTPSIRTAVDSSAPASPIVASSSSVSGSATET